MQFSFWSSGFNWDHYTHNLLSVIDRKQDARLSVQWRHNECDGVFNHRRPDCLLSRLFRRRSMKISKLRVVGLYEGNWPVICEFPAERANNAENVSIWWRHHVLFVRKRPGTKNKSYNIQLSTQQGRVMNLCVSKLGHHCFRYWLVACSTQILSMSSLSIVWKKISKMWIKKVHLKNVVCKMAAIIYLPRCVKQFRQAMCTVYEKRTILM